MEYDGNRMVSQNACRDKMPIDYMIHLKEWCRTADTKRQWFTPFESGDAVAKCVQRDADVTIEAQECSSQFG